MDEIDQQILAELTELAELAELDALGAACARGEYVPLPVNTLPPPPEGWFPCPCCGHQMFGGLGEYEICAVCNVEARLLAPERAAHRAVLHSALVRRERLRWSGS
ncbi:CPCC family cysteine-rich protein [Streptomyces sp. NPDC000594]|uniref:CPCC family cysteine-rich protein n=1 Tax=Streptomyces sp. NPDC000594 TaxID=3154261 RepID=UPI00331D69D6